MVAGVGGLGQGVAQVLCSNRVSTSVFMTVLKMDTDSGLPWNTPMPRWKGAVVQCLVVIIGVVRLQVGDYLHEVLRDMVML